jgi:ammonium transporter, Amt family
MYNLGDLGFSDFAGSGIVHMAGATAALAGVILLGPRKGKYGPNGEVRPILGANLPSPPLAPSFSGWAGSALTAARCSSSATYANANAVAMVFLNTNHGGRRRSNRSGC